MHSLKLMCENNYSIFHERMNQIPLNSMQQIQIFEKSSHQIKKISDIFFQLLCQNAAQNNRQISMKF